MSLWQFLAAVEGYTEAHTPPEKKGKGLTAAEVAEIGEWMDRKDG